MYENLFKFLGLNQQEAKIYEILLGLGPSPVRNILKKIDIGRTNLYNVLTTLKKKELVYERLDKNGITFFCPEPPDRLESILSREEEKIIQARRGLANSMRDLRDLYHASEDRPVIRFFEGTEKFKKAYEEMIDEEGTEILVWTSTYGNATMSGFLRDYTKRRAEKGVKTKVISSKRELEVLSRDAELKKERKYFEESLPTEIDVYGNKVAFLSFRKEPIGLVIENKDLAETMQKIFYEMWRKLSKAAPRAKTEIKVSE